MPNAALFLVLFVVTLKFNDVTSTDYIAHTFGNDTAELIHYITRGNGVGLAYRWLSTLVDNFGHRLVGSDSLEEAIDFVVRGLEEENFDEVHTEEVPDLPHWVRGDDIVELIEPRRQRLNVLALGGCAPANITGEAVVIRDFKDLRDVNVSGKIVVTTQRWRGYSATVKYRRSTRMFQLLGAIGVLVKSIAPFSISSPHTGNGAGREAPSEVVLISAHLDSWDVGQGALDDGGGCAAMWSALHSLKKLAEKNDAFRPKRTIRAIFWTAEEQGFLGAQHYYNTHKNDSNETFYFVSETDQGAFRPTNWHSYLFFCGDQQQMRRMDDIVRLLNDHEIPLGLQRSASQGDVHFWSDEGIPSINYMSNKGLDYYFYFHHSEGDYMTIFREGDLEYTAAIFAVLAHIIANMDDWGSYDTKNEIIGLLNGFSAGP